MTTIVIKVKLSSIPMPPRLKHASAAEADCNAMDGQGARNSDAVGCGRPEV
jgi:hypothetical protein